MENLSKSISKTKRKKKQKQMKRLAFITQFKIEFYYRLPVMEKCLEKCLLFKGEWKKFLKTWITLVIDKILHYPRKFLLKNPFFKGF